MSSKIHSQPWVKLQWSLKLFEACGSKLFISWKFWQPIELRKKTLIAKETKLMMLPMRDKMPMITPKRSLNYFRVLKSKTFLMAKLRIAKHESSKKLNFVLNKSCKPPVSSLKQLKNVSVFNMSSKFSYSSTIWNYKHTFNIPSKHLNTPTHVRVSRFMIYI